MSKTILVVDSDSALAGQVRSELSSKGFTVEETQDGKGSPEIIRKKKPDLVLLAVGQNSYIICGKLKKDDELKGIPVFIVGSPDGFEAHKKLKTRADEYVAKPVDMGFLKDRVKAIIGFEESSEIDESLTFADLVDDAPAEAPVEELSVEDEPAAAADPALDALDDAFSGITEEPVQVQEDEPVVAPQDGGGDEELSALDGLGQSSESALDDLGDDERTMVAMTAPDLSEPEPVKAAPPPAPTPAPVARSTPAPASRPASSGGGADPAELRAMKDKVASLSSALEAAESRGNELESKVNELETELSSARSDAEAARATGGKSSQDLLSLKQANNAKDKEILKLKSEVNDKDKELVELRDKEMQLEHQVGESTAEIARRDAQIKTLTQKNEQNQADRKKLDQQLLAAKDEARQAKSEVDELKERVSQLEGEASQLEGVRGELDGVRGQLETAQREAEEQKTQLDSVRSELETVRGELDSAKDQVTTQAQSFAEEAQNLRSRVAELEKEIASHEDRVGKFYAKIKSEEKVREKTKKALSIALQLLDEQASELEEPPAEA